MGYGVLFPGQGSQFVGMGSDLFASRSDLLGDTADEVLGWSLRGICLDGPEEELTQTDRAQPALYAISYALWETWLSGGRPSPSAAAGHSLGEYTALAASGAIGYLEGLALVAARGRAMAAAAAASSSGMAALLGVDEDTAEAIAKGRRDRGGSLWVANLNAPGQIVVAGGEQDIAWVVAEGRELGVRRAVELNVAGAFHSPYMEPAAQELAVALEAVAFTSPRFPVWANATAAPHRQSEFADALTSQLTSPVRFAESLAAMEGSGASGFIHIGPGDVTAGMAKRSTSDAATAVLNSADGSTEAAAALGASLQ